MGLVRPLEGFAKCLAILPHIMPKSNIAIMQLIAGKRQKMPVATISIIATSWIAWRKTKMDISINELNAEFIKSALTSLSHIKREGLNSKELAWLDMANVFLAMARKSLDKTD
jgi:hypothetical protein